MGFDNRKITDAQIAANGIQSQPNKLVGTAAENKAKFDKLVLEVVKTALNGLIDDLMGANAAGQIGIDTVEGLTATEVQGALVQIMQAMQDITQGSVADGAITTAKLADGAVTSGKIALLAITESLIGNGAVTSGKLADGAVTAAKIAGLAITTGLIANGAVTTAKIADGAVETAKIKNAAVDNTKLATGAVVTTKIADGAVTAAKLADGAVTAGKIGADVTPESLDAADRIHTHHLGDITDMTANQKRNIFVWPTEPTGAVEGDIWFKVEE